MSTKTSDAEGAPPAKETVLAKGIETSSIAGPNQNLKPMGDEEESSKPAESESFNEDNSQPEGTKNDFKEKPDDGKMSVEGNGEVQIEQYDDYDIQGDYITDEDHVIECTHAVSAAVKKSDLTQLQSIHAAAPASSGIDLRLEETDTRSWTPFLNAVAAANLPLAKQLVRMGADVEARDDDGMDAMHLVTLQGSGEDVKELALNGAVPDGISKRFELPPLHLAALNGDKDQITALVEAGADVTVLSQEGWSALHYAVANGHTAAAAELAKQGCDIEALTHYGYSVNDLCECYSWPGMWKQIEKGNRIYKRNARKARTGHLTVPGGGKKK